jgi:drug/metabolite transporter (DMT)-like permease
MAIIFALIALVGWGVGDVLAGVVSRKIGGFSTAFWLDLFGFALASFYAPFAIGHLQNLTITTGLLLVALVVLGLVPTISLFEGLRLGNASLVGTIVSTFAAVSVILAIVFLGDSISFYQTIAILVIFLGLIMSSIDFKTVRIKQLFTDKGVPYGLVSMVLYGVYFTFIRIPVREIGWFWPAYLSFSVFPITYLFMKFRKIKLQSFKGTGVLKFSIWQAALSVAALFAFNLAVSNGQTAIVTPIAGSYPVLFAVLAYFIFKDRLKKQQIFGILTTLVGIVLLSTV